MPQQPRSKVISASITVPIAVKAVILICYVDLPNPLPTYPLSRKMIYPHTHDLTIQEIKNCMELTKKLAFMN